MIKKLYLNHKEITHDYFWRVVQVASKEGVATLLFFIAVYHLTPNLLGLYSYVMTGVFLLIMFSDFGFSVATSTHVAEYAHKSPHSIKNVLFTMSLPVIFLSFLIASLAFLFVYFFKNQFLNYFIVITPLFFTVPLTALMDGILRGTRQFKKLAIATGCSGLLSLIFGYALIATHGLFGAFLAQSFLFVNLLFFLLIAHHNISFTLDKDFLKKTLKYALIIGITGVGFYLFTRINTIIIGHAGYLHELAHYEIIQKILLIVLMPFSILAQVLAPRITTLVAQGNWLAVRKKYIRIIFLSGFVGTIIAFILYILLVSVSQIFSFGSYDINLLSRTLLLLIPIIITQAMSVVGATGFSTASGHARINMYILLVFGLFNILTTYSFVMMWGYFGAVYSTLAIKVLADTVFLVVYYRIVKKRICQK